MVINWLISCNIVWEGDFFIISRWRLMFIMLIEGGVLTSFANHWTYLPIHQSYIVHIYLHTDPLISFLPTKLHNLSNLKRPANEVHLLMFDVNFLNCSLCDTAIFSWVSKIVRHCLRFALLRSVLGPENSRHPTNQSDAKLISITTRFHALAVLAVAITLVLVLRNYYYNCTINNGSRNEWSPIRSVIIRVIHKIGRLRSGGPIC